MGKEELDRVVAEILEKESRPMSIPEIERKVADREIPADTFDVQRSVHRLLSAGKARTTPLLLVQTASV